MKIADIIAEPCSFEESGFDDGENYWSATSLYEQAEKEKAHPYRLKLRDVDLTRMVWRTDSVRVGDYAYHARRAMNTDLDIPIIVGPLGGIMDGYHRVMRAVIEGRDYIMAMRLVELPESTERKD